MSTFGLIIWGPISQVFQHVSGKKNESTKATPGKDYEVDPIRSRWKSLLTGSCVARVLLVPSTRRPKDGTAVYSAGRNCTSDVKDNMEIERGYITVH